MYLYTRRPLKLPIVLLLKQSTGNICSLLDLSDLSCPLPRFQSWFDFDVSGEETREKIIAQEREQNVLSTLHQVHMYILRSGKFFTRSKILGLKAIRDQIWDVFLLEHLSEIWFPTSQIFLLLTPPLKNDALITGVYSLTPHRSWHRFCCGDWKRTWSSLSLPRRRWWCTLHSL